MTLQIRIAKHENIRNEKIYLPFEPTLLYHFHLKPLSISLTRLIYRRILNAHTSYPH